MRIAALALAVLLWACAGCHTYAPYKPATPSVNTSAYYSWLSSGTYQVQAACLEGSWSGSGVVVGREGDQAFLATANHVVEGTDCTFLVNDQQFRVLATDEAYDQAILVGHATGRVASETAEVFLGQDVIVVGYPNQPYTGETGKQVTKGSVSSYVTRRYKVSAQAYYGNSGGPAFDSEGKLVGLVVQIVIFDSEGTPFPGEVFVTPAWRTYTLLEEARASLR
jgi:S1-C subfamily serine protease